MAESSVCVLRGSTGRQLLMLAAAAAAGLYARTALGPVQETLSRDLSLSDAQVSLLQGPALALPLLILSIPLGLLIDRKSRARMLMLAVALSGIGTALTAFAPSFAWLLAARCIVGFAAPATGVIAYAMISDLFTPATRGRATTVVVLGQLLGSSGAFLLGGYFLSLFGSAGGNWRWAVAAMAALCVPFALLSLRIVEPQRKQHAAAAPVSQAWLQLRQNRAVFIPLIVGMALVGLADGAALVWTAPLLERDFGLPPQRVGALVGSILLIAGVAGPLLGGWLADICHERGGPRLSVTTMAALAAVSLPCSLFALVPSPNGLAAALLIFVTLGPAISVMVTAVTLIVMPPELRGLCVSIKFATGTLFGIGVAPLAVGLLSSALGEAKGLREALALVCFGTSALGALILFVERRHFARATSPC